MLSDRPAAEQTPTRPLNIAPGSFLNSTQWQDTSLIEMKFTLPMTKDLQLQGDFLIFKHTFLNCVIFSNTTLFPNPT